MHYQVAIAGSTKYSQQAAAALAADSNFSVPYVITPTPRHIGRDQKLVNNPLHQWAEQEKLPSFLINKNLEEAIFTDFRQDKPEIDFLLVLDFGYFIPRWLLVLPKIAPVNIHPSLLPKWRGSSPGQFALLFQDFSQNYFAQQLGGKQSAVTLMLMNNLFDQGPIIQQLPFMIEDNWRQSEYYDYAFNLICPRLADLLNNFAQGKIVSRKQPLAASTPIARRLNKEDSYVDWEFLQQLNNNQEKASIEQKKEAQNKLNDSPEAIFQNGPLLMNLLADPLISSSLEAQKQLLVNAAKAFWPKPGLWTTIKTKKGQKRLKLLKLKLQDKDLVLEMVQVEGQQPASFQQIKNLLI